MKISELKQIIKEEVENEIEEREALADYAHDAWSRWMTHLFKKSTSNKDGTVTIPKWAVDRWKRQINTPYNELSKSEKDSDRDEADKMLDTISGEK